MKKRTYLFPLLMSTSLCGCSNQNNPYIVTTGGTVLVMSKEEDQTKLSNYIDETVRNTLTSMQNSFSLTLSLDTLEGKYESSSININVDDASLKLKIDVANAEGQLKNIKAKAVISNLNLRGTYLDNASNSAINANIDNAGFKAYFTDGVPCVDLKNNNLIEGASNIYAQYLELTGEDSEGSKALIKQLAGKYCFKGLIDEDFLEEKMLTRDVVENVVDFDCGYEAVNFLSDETYASFFDTIMYNDNSLAIKASANSETIKALLPEYNFSDDSYADVVIKTDTNKRISSLAIKGNIGLDIEEQFKINAAIALSLVFSYNTSKPKMPNLAEFTPFPMYLLG